MNRSSIIVCVCCSLGLLVIAVAQYSGSVSQDSNAVQTASPPASTPQPVVTTQPQPPSEKKLVLSPEDRASLLQQGLDPDTFVPAEQAPQPQQQPQVGGMAFVGSFQGSTNFFIPPDNVMSTKPHWIKFQFVGQTFEVSGHYGIMLNTPKAHSNPLFGFGKPEKAKFVVIEDFGGATYPLPDATIWEKGDGYIDCEAMGKEWIYSGNYTIQN